MYDRRELLCFMFAKRGLRLSQFRNLFPVTKSVHIMEKRNQDQYVVNKAKTEKYKRLTIPSMQRLLNKFERNLKSAFTSLSHCTNEFYPCGLSLRNFNSNKKIKILVDIDWDLKRNMKKT